MSIPLITYEQSIARVSCRAAVEALRSGHKRPKAEVSDMCLRPSSGTLLSRGAFIEGLGYEVNP